MNVIFILIAVSLMVAIGFLVTFIWSIRSGQYEDDYTPSVRILFDNDVNVLPEQQKKPAEDKQEQEEQEPNQKSQIDNKPKI